MKDTEDKNHWLVDEEAAEVVRKIFRLTVEGMGPYQIAKRLMEEKVEKPSYYQATRQRGNYKTMCDFETPYNWTGGSVVRILDLAKKEKRFADLDLLIKKVYEDNAMGKLPDRRYEMLSSDYEKEQQEIEISIREIQEKLMQFEEDTDRTEEFLSLVHKYTDIQELTPAIVNEFVDKVMVHKIEKTDGDRMQEIEIFLNYIGKLPVYFK